jgi:hypothetical protein
MDMVNTNRFCKILAEFEFNYVETVDYEEIHRSNTAAHEKFGQDIIYTGVSDSVEWFDYHSEASCIISVAILSCHNKGHD